MSELYELPDGWEWKKLIETVNISNKTVTVNDNKEYHCIGLEHIESNTGRLVNFTLSNGEEIKSSKVTFEKNMVLYGKLRPYLNKVWTAEFDGIATTEILPFKPIENMLDSNYLSHYLRTSYFINNAMKNISGARMPRITTKYIKNEAYIPLPPLQEQKRIVSKLDTLFEKIDKAIALHQKNMDEADVFMGSVLNEVFGELEEKYEKKPLGDLTKTTSGGTPKRNERSYWGGTIGWLKSGELNNGYVAEVQEYITEEGLKKSSAKLFPKGTLLIAMYGATVGKLAILDIETTTNQAICGVLNDKQLFETKYMFYFFQKSKEKMLLDSTGGAQPNISQTYLKQLSVIYPPLNIQQNIVQYLDQISEKTEKVKSVQKEKMESLKALKASLLDRAFRGEL